MGVVTQRVTESSLFNEPSATGEIAPAPAAPMPTVPAMPAGFVAPTADEHLRCDAERGAGEITTS